MSLQCVFAEVLGHTAELILCLSAGTRWSTIFVSIVLMSIAGAGLGIVEMSSAIDASDFADFFSYTDRAIQVFYSAARGPYQNMYDDIASHKFWIVGGYTGLTSPTAKQRIARLMGLCIMLRHDFSELLYPVDHSQGGASN